jgi:hypothetical protein
MEEPIPRRGEIWRVRLYRRQGTETIGAHPCLIVSDDSLNEDYPLVTIVPIITHAPHKEEVMSLWGVTIQCSKWNRTRGGYIDADIEIYQENSNYQNEQLRPTRSIEIDRQGNIIHVPYKSIIDCGQIGAISKNLPPTHARYELHWERYHGKLKPHVMDLVDAALEAVIGGDIGYNGHLDRREGEVLVLNLPGMPIQRCLVVSSPGVDALREQPTYKALRTVVPLVSTQVTKDLPEVPEEKLVDVYPIGKTTPPTTEIARCYQIYTVDWRSREVRNATGPVGRVYDRNVDDVSARDMVDVREALRYCLKLPH